METDVVIIGGGVTGSAVAHRLARYNLDIILVEKEADIASGTSKANSGIVHAGYNADPETMKGRLNIAANPRFDRLCADLKVPFERTGSLLVGFDESDLEVIKKKKENGTKNSIPGLEIIGRERLREMEPEVSPEARWALYAPTAGIVSPHEFTVALAENAVLNGVQVLLETEVKDIIVERNSVQSVVTTQGQIDCELVINAAGIYADRVAGFVGEKMEINPRKGEYFIFDREYGDLVNHVLFPTPTEKSKGILVTSTAHGNLLIGPNANPAKKGDFSTTRSGLAEVLKGAKKLVPGLPVGGVISSFAGLRAALPGEDFHIQFSHKVEGLIHAAGIQSPGLTAAPATAERIKDLVFEFYASGSGQNKIEPKNEVQETLPRKPHLYDYLEQERDKWQEIVEKNEDYGEVICRCEHVTRGEIIAAINSPVPARTVDAIKKRTRAGMGRCQGGFCGPRVVEILSQELDIPPTEVTQKGPGSEILEAGTKELRLNSQKQE
ncbi:MAG: NAD(P)/FAD-dependent oxidoreductase [Halanaerobiaceae bacterium]